MTRRRYFPDDVPDPVESRRLTDEEAEAYEEGVRARQRAANAGYRPDEYVHDVALNPGVRPSGWHDDDDPNSATGGPVR